MAALISALQTAGAGDTVRLGNRCTYTLTAAFSGIDGLPPVAVSLTIDGRRATIRRSSASATPLFRILHVGASGKLALKNVTLRNGSLANAPGNNGGGILNSGGTLSMDGVTIVGNKAFQGGGVNSYGGAFTMSNSRVLNNEGTDHGGGMHVYGNVNITDSQVKNNTAWILAGGLLAGGPTLLLRTVVSGNTAGAGGGIISYTGNSPVTLVNSTVTNNTALGFGGIFSYGSTLSVIGSTISGNKATQGTGGGIETPGTLAIVSSTVANNQASTHGGGIYSNGLLVLSDSSVTGNSALFGGGVAAYGTATVYRTAFSGNTASQDAGAIRTGSPAVSIIDSTFSSNTAIFGGAVKAYGTLSVSGSTFTGNSASLGGALALLFSPAAATIVNSTFWANAAGVGGAMITYGALRVLSSSIGANSASSADSAGGIHVVTFNGPVGSLEIRNSIVATNSGAYPNVGGPVTSLGYNVIGATTGSSGWAASDSTGIASPGLGAALAGNGGPTQTVELLAGSPAIDFVPVGSCLNPSGAALATDQRGVARPSGSACDAGAFER